MVEWTDKGGTYEIALGKPKYLNQDQSRFRIMVYIRRRMPKSPTIERVGDGRLIGNFSPIWVNWDGAKVQIEKILEIGG
jgi:hypothetical protein